MAFVRDVNGDGLADLVGGRPGRGGGQVLLLMGTRGLIGNPILMSPGARFAGGLFGCSVSTAGDVNGDGLDDLLVGASRSGREHYREGAAFVFHGSKAGLSATPAWRALGGWKRAYLGKCVANAGDVNGDGFGDVLVGAPEYSGLKEQAGRAMLFLGSTNGLAEQPAWHADGNRSFAALGSAVASAGDVNHDGYADILIGAPGVESQSAPPGQAFLFLGSRSGPRKDPDWIAEGEQPFSKFGAAVSTARDVNGDGFDDVLVGAPMHRERWQEEGRVALYLGATNGPERTPVWTADGGQFEARFGWAVAPAGDVNQDGLADFIVGAPFFDCGKKDEGRVDVFYGSRTGYQRVTNIVPLALAQASPRWFTGTTHTKHQYFLLFGLAGLFACLAWYWARRRQVTAALRERERLARDLHDGLGTDLAQLSLLAGRAAGAHEQPSTDSLIPDLPSKAREMMRTMEEIVWATNPANDTLENAVTFLGQYAERLFAGTTIRAFQEIPVELPECMLAGHVRKNILLAVKEALTNSLKHSNATEVWLRVSCENSVLRIFIEDNGCGFETDSTRRFGNGLANMKARMEEVQAHCEFVSKPGNGTRVELRIGLALS